MEVEIDEGKRKFIIRIGPIVGTEQNTKDKIATQLIIRAFRHSR